MMTVILFTLDIQFIVLYHYFYAIKYGVWHFIKCWYTAHFIMFLYAAGAGFLIPITGDIMRMPGLPAHPASENIDINDDGEITGLF